MGTVRGLDCTSRLLTLLSCCLYIAQNNKNIIQNVKIPRGGHKVQICKIFLLNNENELDFFGEIVLDFGQLNHDDDLWQKKGLREQACAEWRFLTSR